ncbi:hypothetical protein LCGC14_1091400 [marine sediment metagenome]|uniref:Uncharacterized protein n=1 Tax=marine sediment metagenome TaxID=412755 RepID=A0A0F9MCA9_9ZZZZ
MTYEEYIKSLDLPSGVGISTSEAFQAGRESLAAELEEFWDDTKSMGEFAEDVAGFLGVL